MEERKTLKDILSGELYTLSFSPEELVSLCSFLYTAGAFMKGTPEDDYRIAKNRIRIDILLHEKGVVKCQECRLNEAKQQFKTDYRVFITQDKHPLDI